MTLRAHWARPPITTEEREVVKDMVTSDDYRHVPTGTLAILAQRLGFFPGRVHSDILPISCFASTAAISSQEGAR